MREKQKLFCIILLIITLGISLKFYFENSDLKAKIADSESKYQDLRAKKINDNFSEATLSEISLVQDTFDWMHSEDADSIILENYSGRSINLKEKSKLNVLILNGIYLEKNVIIPKNIISTKIHNDYRFYYTLRYNFKETDNEILIYDDGTIKYKDAYYESPFLLSSAQSLLPVTDELSIEFNNAMDVMLNTALATNTDYMFTNTDEKSSEAALFYLWDNAVRLRATAHFINKNMVKTSKKIIESSDMMVLKSTGYCEGKQADMYIYTVNGGEVSHVRLIYNDIEEVYKLKPELKTNPKYIYLNNIWTAD
ncbi:MAG: hypothetical protein AAGU76_15365 [Sedimentibacter sp.]|uniref:hypothetical protein n=1 Tax=Sedimentibacter sp. TaxID=1960295 RepID=UPI003158CF57